MHYTIILTTARTLYVALPPTGRFWRVARVHPPRTYAPEAPAVQELTGTLESVEMSSAGVGPHLYSASRALFRPIPGTEGAPRCGERMIVGGLECPMEVTCPVQFVHDMPASRAWVIPHMIRAHRAGDPVAHLLVHEQPFERELGADDSFYSRYRAYRAEVMSAGTPGEPKARGIARDALAAELLVAAGAGELTDFAGIPDHVRRGILEGITIAEGFLEEAFENLQATGTFTARRERLAA